MLTHDSQLNKVIPIRLQFLIKSWNWEMFIKTKIDIFCSCMFQLEQNYGPPLKIFFSNLKYVPPIGQLKSEHWSIIHLSFLSFFLSFLLSFILKFAKIVMCPILRLKELLKISKSLQKMCFCWNLQILFTILGLIQSFTV